MLWCMVLMKSCLKWIRTTATSFRAISIWCVCVLKWKYFVCYLNIFWCFSWLNYLNMLMCLFWVKLMFASLRRIRICASSREFGARLDDVCLMFMFLLCIFEWKVYFEILILLICVVGCWVWWCVLSWRRRARNFSFFARLLRVLLMLLMCVLLLMFLLLFVCVCFVLLFFGIWCVSFMGIFNCLLDFN